MEFLDALTRALQPAKTANCKIRPQCKPGPKSEQNGEHKSSEHPFFENYPMQGWLVTSLPALDGRRGALRCQPGIIYP